MSSQQHRKAEEMFETGTKVADGSFDLVVFDEHTIVIKSHTSGKFYIYEEASQ